MAFPANGLNRGPEGPAAHLSIYLALLPSGPDAVRRLKLHRFRTAVQSARAIVLHFMVCGRSGVRGFGRSQVPRCSNVSNSRTRELGNSRTAERPRTVRSG